MEVTASASLIAKCAEGVISGARKLLQLLIVFSRDETLASFQRVKCARTHQSMLNALEKVPRLRQARLLERY